MELPHQIQNTTRSKAGYQRNNGRWEARYRPQCRFELNEDEVTKGAFKGYKNGLYKYEFLEYFDTSAEKDAWLKNLKEDFARRKLESDPAINSNKRKIDTDIILKKPRIEDDVYEIFNAMTRENIGLTEEQNSESDETQSHLPPTTVMNDQKLNPKSPVAGRRQTPLSKISVTSARMVWYCTACKTCYDNPAEHASAHQPSTPYYKHSEPPKTLNEQQPDSYCQSLPYPGTSPNGNSAHERLSQEQPPSFNQTQTSHPFPQSPTTTLTSSDEENENDLIGDELLDGLFSWVAHEVGDSETAIQNLLC